MSLIAPLLYAALAGVLVAFQLALALGAPWGHLAMGGRWPGQLPMGMRIAAVFQASLIAVFGGVVLARAGLLDAPPVPDWIIWVVLAFSALAAVMNLITPSRPERRLWGPVALLMLGCVVWIVFIPL